VLVNSAPQARGKRLPQILGCLTVLTKDKAVYSSFLYKTEESYTQEAISRQTQPTEEKIVFGAGHH